MAVYQSCNFTSPVVVSGIGAGATELAGARAPQIPDSGGIGAQCKFIGHPLKNFRHFMLAISVVPT